MCDVCVADEALKAFRKGSFAVFDYSAQAKRDKRVLGAVNPERPGLGVVHVQAVGKAEGPGRYRFRRPGERWSGWHKTADLAGAMGGSGMGWDLAWKYVPEKSRLYLVGRRREPHLETDLEG